MNEAEAEHILNSCKFENITAMFANQIPEVKILLEFLYPHVYYFSKLYNISEWMRDLTLHDGKNYY